MKGFVREDRWCSLCGLNCGLCPMKLEGRCPGCGGGPGNQACAMARCSLEHGGVTYCIQCAEYPCARYDGFDEADSFISHLRRAKDLEKLRRIGPAAYAAEQREKQALLLSLLEWHQEGRRKTLYRQAVNLLNLTDLRSILVELDESREILSRGERAALAEERLQAAADRAGVSLRLRRRGKP